MNEQFKTVLLTILTLSVFTLTIVELTGVSSTAIFNKFHRDAPTSAEPAGSAFDKFKAPDERAQKVAQMPATTIQFAEPMFNFGNLEEGKKYKHSFRFKNTGQNPLMISKTDVSCGCTVTSYSLKPVAPGEEGEISIEFNTAGKSGHQQKNIIVHSNAQPEAQSIGFEAEVK